ncbi:MULTISPECIES: D-sedoheptulose-7-phosphate isomerase [Nocardia]|uniref:Phosphoheptose isomerase n=2 Tax=Nocardia TaxID=1817 RepID=A0A4R6P5N0_NOCIG|nr:MULTISPECIES: SIS domain-containing protein [Nocardia]NKX86336.1 SIS domain-containing protein [Nocardia coubleae]TDP32987.1 phosphoheptose isomerase [Nocardia ignorata]
MNNPPGTRHLVAETGANLEHHFGALGAALERNRTASIRRIWSWGEQLADIYQRNGRLFTCGNGGSAAEAQHLSAELTGRFRTERRPLAAIALHCDTSATTAIVNDYGIEEMFARQLRAHGRPGDALVVLSTSGSSPNVVATAKAAHEMGITTWALTGPPPNTLASVCDDAIAVEADSVATVQEMHLVLVHALCTALDAALEAL